METNRGETSLACAQGCGQPPDFPVRAPIEDKLAHERKQVRFGEGSSATNPTTGLEKIVRQESGQCRPDRSSMNVTPIEQRPPHDRFTVGLKGYGQPHQHPVWTTSQSVYGRYAPPPGLNPTKRPRNSNFTKRQGIGGLSVDGNFTTSTETEYIYRPMHK